MTSIIRWPCKAVTSSMCGSFVQNVQHKPARLVKGMSTSYLSETGPCMPCTVMVLR